ncbi:MAG: hypothetical protein JW785_00355 [Acidimicrobiia bacterium]|nr:hypothetical protein [Acidimicrobiia bacterium]
MDAPRLLTIMGSGETTATMVPVHRTVFARFPERPVVAVLDTPYGFQENADELTARAVSYFRTSLPMAEVTVASLRSSRESAAGREQALETLRRADVIFAGPGSPSYALRVWAATPVPAILKAKALAGALTMASAASITLGRFSLPVYEIYKVGNDPHWLDGLDVLAVHGIRAVVVPHWNNAEGGTHDTSRCWLGLRRFDALAATLPPGITVLGVDEHTACLLDFTGDRFAVAGKGTVTVLSGGSETVLGPGETAPLDHLRSRAGSRRPAAPTEPLTVAQAAGFAAAFDAALGAGETAAALDAILSLEDAHERWPPAEAAAAHDALRTMATRLAAALSARGLDGGEWAAAVEALVAVRSRARDDGRWDDADTIRRALALLAVEVRDTPQGTVWDSAHGD